MLKIKDEESSRYDLVSLGALVRRFDPGITPLHEATQFTSHCSGAEYNPAANLSNCFGMRTAIVSANVLYPTGWWVQKQVRSMGVDGIWKWYDFDGIGNPRIANTYSDQGFGSRAPEVWYDRANEAAARLKAGDIDWQDVFEKRGTRWFHSGGLFAALSPTAADVILEGMTAAKKSHAVTSYDLNFRQKLWEAVGGGAARAVDVNRRIVQKADVLLGNEEDLQKGLGIPGPEVAAGSSFDQEVFQENGGLNTSLFEEMIGRVRKEFPHLQLIATTLRKVISTSQHLWAAVMWYDGKFYKQEPVRLDILDRIGGGDGFAAGLFYALLKERAPQEALRLAWAHGGLLTTTPGDTTMVRPEQVEGFPAGRVRR
jgi:2-dehydro-3-deoxygluconokinase